MTNFEGLTPCNYFKTCLLVYALSLADAAKVTVEVFGGLDYHNTLSCNTNATFVCSVTPVSNTMTWSIDNTTVAGCTFGACVNRSSKPANNIFEYDTSNGIYNLTFRPVLGSDDRKVYKCQVGPNSTSISPSVKVFPDETSSAITNSTTSNGIDIMASTCSSGSLTFEWYIFKDGEDAISYNMQPMDRHNISSCLSTLNCNGQRSTSTLTIKDQGEQGGDYFFFRVKIVYSFSEDVEPYILTVDSSNSFKLQGTNGSNGEDNSGNSGESKEKAGGLKDWAIAAISVPVILVCLVVITGVAICVKSKKSEQRQDIPLKVNNIGRQTVVDLEKQNVRPNQPPNDANNTFSKSKPLPEITKSHGRVYIEHGDAHIFGVTIHLPFGNNHRNRLAPMEKVKNGNKRTDRIRPN